MTEGHEVVVTPGELEQLLTVRAMLEGARRAVANRSPVDGITPTVLLDAVAERAAHLVAVSLGLHVGQRDGIDELAPKISDRLADAWAPRTLPEIKLLHRARNGAQHEGLSPDPARLPGWSIAVDAFVRSIIDAPFGVDLERVALSDAIRDAKLREQIVAAIGHLNAGDYAACVREARGTVDEAAGLWRRLHGNRRSPMPPASTIRLSGLMGGGDPVRREVERLAQLIDLTAFAGDASDAAWFDALSGVADDLLDQDDAERAVGFATWWVLGFEGASSTWVADREHRRDIALRRVRDGERPARIDSVVSLRPGAFSPGWDLVVRLVDVPDEAGWNDWRKSVASLQNTPDRAPGPLWYVNEDGTARIHGLDRDTASAELERLHEVLLTADGAATTTATDAAAREANREARHIAFAEAIAAAGPLPTWVSGISTLRASWAPDLMLKRLTVDARALRVPASPTTGGSLLREAIEALPEVNDLQVLGGTTIEIRSDVHPNTLVDLLRELDLEMQAGLAVIVEAEHEHDAEIDEVRTLIEGVITRLANTE